MECQGHAYLDFHTYSNGRTDYKTDDRTDERKANIQSHTKTCIQMRKRKKVCEYGGGGGKF